MAGRASDHSAPSVRHVLIWTSLTFAMVGAAGATGYLVAAATADADVQSPAHDPPLSSSPGLIDVRAVFGSGYAAGRRASREGALARGRREGRSEERFVWQRRLRRDGPTYRRIYEAGRASGSRAALERFAFTGDGIYAVGVAQRGLEVKGSYGPLRKGAGYRLCKDGTALCDAEKPGD